MLHSSSRAVPGPYPLPPHITEPLFPNPTTGEIPHYCVRRLSINQEGNFICTLHNRMLRKVYHSRSSLGRKSTYSDLHLTVDCILAECFSPIHSHPTSSHFFPSTTTTVKIKIPRKQADKQTPTFNKEERVVR